MDVLTVKQPHASLIVEGIKPIENRTWKCPQKYIGKRVLIHAGMAKTSGLMARYLTHEQLLDFREKFGWSGLDFLEPLGAIIGSVEIVDCVINHPSIWAEKQHCTYHTPCKDLSKHPNCFDGCMHFSKPIYNWVLANPIKFEKPIPCKGKLSFWEYPDELLKQNYIISCDSSTDKTDYTAETTFKITDGKSEIAEIKT